MRPRRRPWWLSSGSVVHNMSNWIRPRPKAAGLCGKRLTMRWGANARVNQPSTVSLETLAAQGMGEVDAVSGDLVPPIHMSTTYERQTDGSYHQDRVYTRADNPTFELAERVLAALERRIKLCLVRLRDGGDYGNLPVARSGGPRTGLASVVLGRSKVAGGVRVDVGSRC